MDLERKVRDRINELKQAREQMRIRFEQMNAAIGELEALLKEDEKEEANNG